MSHWLGLRDEQTSMDDWSKRVRSFVRSLVGFVCCKRAVAGSFGHFAALLADGSVVTWGDPDTRQRGMSQMH